MKMHTCTELLKWVFVVLELLSVIRLTLQKRVSKLGRNPKYESSFRKRYPHSSAKVTSNSVMTPRTRFHINIQKRRHFTPV